MRRIDYWLGVPLCFLLSLINYVSRVIDVKTKKDIVPQKLLFIKLSEMGSIILSYPLVSKVRTEYPNADIFFLTFRKNKPLFEILNIVPEHNVLSISDDSVSLLIWDTLRVIKKLRKEKIDIVFDLEFFSRFTAILSYLSNASKKVGFYSYTQEGLYRGNFLTHKVQLNPLLHISKSYFSFCQAAKEKIKSSPNLGESIKDNEISVPKSAPSEEEETKMRKRLKGFGVQEDDRLILINLGEGNIPLREWPLEKFVALAKKLLEEGNNYIVAIGTQSASRKAELFRRSINSKRVIDFSGKTNLLELLTLFNLADILVANDSGLAHLASFANIKKFIIFGPESPQVYTPFGENTCIIYSSLPCSPCFSAFNHRNSACQDNQCLKIIRPDEVYEMIKAYLK